MKPSREITKISMKAVVINIYISINGEKWFTDNFVQDFTMHLF